MDRRQGPRSTRFRWIPLAGLPSLSGCDPEYGSLRIREGAGEFDAAYVGSDGIVVEEGHVVIAFAEPISARGSEEYQGLERFQVEAANPSIATVSRGVLRGSFVIAGARIGTTQLEVLINGKIVGSVPLEVVDQGGPMKRLLSFVLGLGGALAPVAQAYAAPPTETAQPAAPPDAGALAGASATVRF